MDIATGLWEMMIPLDPDSEFSKEHLQWWTDFLVSKGSKSVSKDTWNLVSLLLGLLLLYLVRQETQNMMELVLCSLLTCLSIK